MKNKFIPYKPEKFKEQNMLKRSRKFYEFMNTRRSIREFSDKPVPKKLIEDILLTASTAPSGANKQPWTFCVITDPEIKKQLRKAAEKEEFENYNGRMDDQWLKDLAPLGTDWHKPFLETAPYLIVVFKKLFDINKDGSHRQNYYVNESVGIACGFLLAAIHNAGLAALTHTPSPMGFLTKLLKRPLNERPFLIIPVGYPAKEAKVPDIKRKKLKDIYVKY